MTQRKQFFTKEMPCLLMMQIEGYGLTRFEGFDATQDYTVFFRREKVLNGPETIWFNMPISPRTLTLEVRNINGIKVKNSEIHRLPTPPVFASAEEHDFFDLAAEFCSEAGYQPTGVYMDDLEEHIINYPQTIRDANTGKEQATPAKMNHSTRIIEASQKQFRQFTIPVRYFILLHEFYHGFLESSDELSVDLKTLDVYLKLWFPPTEAIYAETQVFRDNPQTIQRVKQIMSVVSAFDRRYNLFQILKNQPN